MSDKDNKKKKKKVIYYDDGRTIADMSNLYGKTSSDGEKKKESYTTGGEPDYKGNPYFGKFRPGHTPKDWLKTYWETVKLMILPMFATLGIIAAAFLIMYILLEIAS